MQTLGKADVVVKRFDHRNGHELLPQIVDCYREVFADGPWHEWKTCPHCGKYWGKKDREALERMSFEHCGHPLVDFWPTEKVANDIITLPEEASIYVAINDDDVVGFCWGYPISIQELENDLGITFSSDIYDNFGTIERVAYQDDIGVKISYRGNGIAKEMFSARLSDFLDQRLEVAIVRTRALPEPSVTYGWFVHKLGYRILKEYPEGDGRVILATSLNNLNNVSK